MNLPRRHCAFAIGLLFSLLTGCGGGASGVDPILGGPIAGTAPTVTATTPVASTPVANGVPTTTLVSAAFSKAIAPATLGPASVTLSCANGASVPSEVEYDDATRVVTLTPDKALPANALCVATITTAVQDQLGLALAADFVWSFRTAPTADEDAPSVVRTIPADEAGNVPINTRIAAVFDEAMDASTITARSFTLVNTSLGTAVSGTVSYSATGYTAVFTPTSPATLEADSEFTATITTRAADLSGNPIVANFVWTFETAATADTLAPTVAVTVPAPSTAQVPRNTAITATFSEDMNPVTLAGGSFTLVNTTLDTAVPGTLSYSAASRTAIFTPTTPAILAADSQFTATLTTDAQDLAGNALEEDYVWTFGTGALADTTRPTVVVTTPAPGDGEVATNAKITATLSESMNPASLTETSFTLVDDTLDAPVLGTVSYSVSSRTATFTPTAPATLPANSAFTATLAQTATDLAGNELAGNEAVIPGAGDHVWTFTTAAQGDLEAPTVTVVSPPDGSTGVCRTKPVSATFSEPMDPSTIDSSTFTVSMEGDLVAGMVSYDPLTRAASFVPTAASGFAANESFDVTVHAGDTGVKDLAGNELTDDREWEFTTGAQPCIEAVDLGAAATFGAFGGAAGMTNQGINTVVGGDIGTTAVCTSMTGFHDATDVYTETPLNVGAVNGSIYCAPPAPGTTSTLAIATQARADAQTAYDELAALPAGGDPGAGELGGLVLPAGVYTAAGGTFAITGDDLTLDAQGDIHAVWVMQSAAALTVGQPAFPRRVVLINGAQAKNVFWQVGSAGRIEDGSEMAGTIIAVAGVTISTAGQTAQTTLNGRAIGLTASVTMVNTTIVAP